MARETRAKNKKRSGGGTLYWMVGILLMFTMVSVWLVCGLFAKYVTSGDDADSARVAGTGVVDFDVWEHMAENVSDTDPTTVYELKTDELVKENTYNTIPPGYDIPKDPFVRLELKDSEVDYYLYVKVIKSADFPSTITVTLSSDWEEVPNEENLYRFKGDVDDDEFQIVNGYIDAGTLKHDFYILEDNQIIVSQFYDGTPFEISFEAYLKQVD